MSSEEIGLLMSLEGQLISINQFFSTTIDRTVALFFLASDEIEEGKHRVLFEIDVDSKTPNAKPFTNIRAKSFICDENEILLMLCSVFRVNEIQQKNDVWVIHFTLCGRREIDEKEMLQHWKKIMDERINLQVLCLHHLRKFKVADRCYRCFSQTKLSTTDYDLGKYDENLDMDNRILNMFEFLGFANLNIIEYYNDMGEAYSAKGDYMRAFTSYEKALHLLKTIYGEEKEKVALCLHNIVDQHMQQKVFRKALPYEQQALNIMTKVAPVEHT
jgi:tetratricopeptide (TPR) repeat protein